MINKISCIGIIGDGCGGGREFIIENNTLYAHDPLTKEDIILLKKIKGAKSILKQNCILHITCEHESFEFDLSKIGKNN